MYWSAGLSVVSDIPGKPHWPIKTHMFVNAGRLDSRNPSTYTDPSLYSTQLVV
jgi:outer membrane protein insertion porin family